MERRRFLKASTGLVGIGALQGVTSASEMNSFSGLEEIFTSWVAEHGRIMERTVELMSNTDMSGVKTYRMHFDFSDGKSEKLTIRAINGESRVLVDGEVYSGDSDHEMNRNGRAAMPELEGEDDAFNSNIEGINSRRGTARNVEVADQSHQVSYDPTTGAVSVANTSKPRVKSQGTEIISRSEGYTYIQSDICEVGCPGDGGNDYDHQLSGLSVELGPGIADGTKAAATAAILAAINAAGGPLAGVSVGWLGQAIGSTIGAYIGGAFVGDTISFAAIDFDLLWGLGEDRMLNAAVAAGPWKPDTNALMTINSKPGHLSPHC